MSVSVNIGMNMSAMGGVYVSPCRTDLGKLVSMEITADQESCPQLQGFHMQKVSGFHR